MHRYIPRLALAIVVALACSPATVARAQASTWNVGSGNWNTPGNWSPSGVPGAGATIDFINFDGVPRTITYDYTGPAVTLGNIYIDLYGNISGGANILSMSSNSLTAEGIMFVGDNGNGEVDQSGGTVTLNQPSGNDLIIGYETGSSGTYNLSGSGVLNATGVEEITIGLASTGIFNQTGGTNTCAGVYIGGNNNNGAGTATYNLHAGALQAGIHVYAGGTFNQFGGSATVPDSQDFSVEQGTYNLSNGNLTGTGPEPQEFINNGNFVQSGGTNSAFRLDVLTSSGTEQSTYTLSAGSLTVNSAAGDTTEAFEALTGDGATFTQTGGTNTIGGTGDLFIGYDNSGSGNSSTYSLSGTGVLTVNSGSEYIGYGNGDSGAFNQSGGTHTLAAGNYLYLGFNSGAQGT
jgi:hypothetical protein